MEMNDILDKLPRHLMNLVIDQPYNAYTAQDHAIWRYVMRQNVRYLKKVAHHSYTEGLKRTGISIDSIPHMYGMNRILREIGWAAVAVDGFIPPAAFMEFQAYKVLVIAADIRTIDQIEYTPAPDIIHEAAGHAPIIADPEYAEYLRYFGEVGSKAFSSAQNYSIYEAIRHLSILKADPYSTRDEIKQAEYDLAELEKYADQESEMSRMRNLHWWTVEYGLVGDLANPRIYGAGLLSSIGESFSSLQPQVKKLPYTVEAANQNFDITTRQPQLYVTPNFDHLIDVLDLFTCNLAFRRGGLYGVNQAIESENTATVVYNSGLQVSGTFTDVIANNGSAVYIRTAGPTALAYRNSQLDGHGKTYHAHGFGSPVGPLKGLSKPLFTSTDGDLEAAGISVNKQAVLVFESGVTVKGQVNSTTRKEGHLLLISFTDCLVTYRDQVLFEPAWGTFDMAVGDKIDSAYSGPADPNAFEHTFDPPREKTHKIVHSTEARRLHSFYQQVRDVREGKEGSDDLVSLYAILKSDYPDEWLLVLEILELVSQSENDSATRDLTNYIIGLKEKHPELENLVDNGLAMISERITGVRATP